MKSTDKIKLNTSVTVLDKDGTAVDAPATRTIRQEIERLRSCGFNDAADRLESSCDDTHLDTGKYVEIDPTHTVDDKGKAQPFSPKWAEKDVMGETVIPAKRPKGEPLTAQERREERREEVAMEKAEAREEKAAAADEKKKKK